MNEQFSILKKQPFLAHAMQRVLQADKLAHAYLLEGAKEAGQEEMALFLAAGVFLHERAKTLWRVSDLSAYSPERLWGFGVDDQ